MDFRVGLGHDLHRLVAGRPLLLGNIEIPFERGLEGHSDADVLLHAVTDALLGACALGDIGEWFPDTDPRYKDANSIVFLQAALDEVFSRGWQIVNVDATIFAQRPKLSTYKPAIRGRLADLLGISVDDVNIKAKTGERVGPIGREEAIAADVVVLLRRADRADGAG